MAEAALSLFPSLSPSSFLTLSVLLSFPSFLSFSVRIVRSSGSSSDKYGWATLSPVHISLSVLLCHETPLLRGSLALCARREPFPGFIALTTDSSSGDIARVGVPLIYFDFLSRTFLHFDGTTTSLSPYLLSFLTIGSRCFRTGNIPLLRGKRWEMRSAIVVDSAHGIRCNVTECSVLLL